jgi:hypothetical protein
MKLIVINIGQQRGNHFALALRGVGDYGSSTTLMSFPIVDRLVGTENPSVQGNLACHVKGAARKAQSNAMRRQHSSGNRFGTYRSNKLH